MIGALLGDFLPYIISALIGIGALIGVYAGGRKAGADKTKRKAADKRADDLQTAKEKRDEVDGLNDDAVAGELHKWFRD
jgi:hypothetical protein